MRWRGSFFGFSYCLSYFLSLVRTGTRGLRKPQLDGDLRRIRGGGELELCVRYCHDLDRSHAIK